MRILVVEDDHSIATFIAGGLRQEGFAVDVAEDGVSGLELARAGPYDAAVVDVMLPRLDGLSLVTALRHAGIPTPVLFLSARHTVDDRVKGLQTGGDDYLAKPFAFGELLARIEALLRRGNQPEVATKIRIADLELDLLGRKVTRGGHPIDVTSKEFQLLEFLARRAGQVVTRTMLLEAVWDLHFDPQTNVIDVHISRLRAAIDKGFDRPLLHTVRGAGYVLRDGG